MAGNALIAGATGLVGGFLLDQLLEDPKYDRIVSLVRKPSGKSHPKLKERLVAFKNIDSLELKTDIDDVFCCLGTTMKKAGSKKRFVEIDYDYPVKLGQIGLSKGAKRYFVVSSLGANRKSPFFYNRVKGKMENSISNLGFDYVGIFRPSLILGDRNERRLGEEIAKKVTSFTDPFLPRNMNRYKGIHAKVIAESIMKDTNEKKTGVNFIESDEMRKTAT